MHGNFQAICDGRRVSRVVFNEQESLKRQFAFTGNCVDKRGGGDFAICLTNKERIAANEWRNILVGPQKNNTEQRR